VCVCLAVILIGERHLLEELANILDQHRLVLDAHHDVLVLHLSQPVEHLLRQILEDREVRIPSKLHLGVDDRHEVVPKEAGELLGGEVCREDKRRLVLQGKLDSLVRIENLLLGERLCRHEHRKLLRLGSRRLNRGLRRDGEFRDRQADIVRVDLSETVEDEVDALRVLGVQLLHDRVHRHTNTILLVLLVSGGNDRAKVEVDRRRVILLHVLLEVELRHLLGDREQRLVDPAGVVSHARKRLDELLVDAILLRLEVPKVQVARATDQLLAANELLGENLVAIMLSLVVRIRCEGETERRRRHLLDDGCNLREAVEDHNLRLRQAIGTLLVEVHHLGVVEGADVEDHRALCHIEVDLRMLEHELVAVLRVEQLRQRRAREDSRHAIDLAQGLIEQHANRFRADPVVVVRIQRAVGRDAPLAGVVVRADHRATKVLGRDETLGEAGTGIQRDVLRARKAEAHDAVVRLRQDRAHCVDDVECLVVVGRNNHEGRVILEHAAVLRLEVLLGLVEALVCEVGGDVANESGHCVGLRGFAVVTDNLGQFSRSVGLAKLSSDRKTVC